MTGLGVMGEENGGLRYRKYTAWTLPWRRKDIFRAGVSAGKAKDGFFGSYSFSHFCLFDGIGIVWEEGADGKWGRR